MAQGKTMFLVWLSLVRCCCSSHLPPQGGATKSVLVLRLFLHTVISHTFCKIKSIFRCSMKDRTSTVAPLKAFFWVSTSGEKWTIFTRWKSNVAGSTNKTVVRPLCLRAESEEWWYSHLLVEHMLSLCPLKAMRELQRVCEFTLLLST